MIPPDFKAFGKKIFFKKLNHSIGRQNEGQTKHVFIFDSEMCVSQSVKKIHEIQAVRGIFEREMTFAHSNKNTY